MLFHWYHGGETDDGETDDGQGGVDVLDRLVSFLRAIIRHPTLAASTHALALYEPLSSRYGHFATFADPERSFGRVFEAVGGYLLQRWRNTNGQTLFLDQLQELAIVRTPALSQLCLDRESEFSDCSWGVWSYPMPNLKFLAFAGNRTGGLEEETYDLKDAMNLLRHAPNLDTLVAPDCWGGASTRIRAHFQKQPWDLMLTGLKKLSLNDVTLDQLRPILDGCPVLENLEYFDDHRLHGLLHEGLERHLGDLRTRLRRLCFSVIPAELPDPDDDDSDEEDERAKFLEMQVWYFGEQSSLTPDFSTFSMLEDLELEQLLLYGPVFPTHDDPRENRSIQLTTPGDLFRRLPPCLRQLRIGFAAYWPVIYRDLLALLEDPSRPFPQLRALTVEVFEAPPEHQHRHLAERLRSILGVSLTVCYVARSQHMSRGLLPARPGRPRLAHAPILYS